MDQFNMREHARKQIQWANDLKGKIATRFIDKKIEPAQFMRMTGRLNSYIANRLPYLL